MFRAFGLAFALLLPGSAAAQSANPSLMSSDAIGPIKRGWVQSDILVLGLPTAVRCEPTEGDPITIYTVAVSSDVAVEVWFGSDDKPYALETNSTAFATAKGARVGDTMARLKELYPQGRISSGLIEGARLSFGLPADSAGAVAGMWFTFETEGLSDDCLREGLGCGDLSAMKSKSFSVVWRPE